MRVRITDRFQLSMLRAGNGAVLRVTPLTKTDARRIAAGAEILRSPPFNASRITQDLQLEEEDPLLLAVGESIVVAEVFSWNHINYFLVKFECDNDGVIDPEDADPLKV